MNGFHLGRPGAWAAAFQSTEVITLTACRFGVLRPAVTPAEPEVYAGLAAGIANGIEGHRGSERR